MSVSAIRIRGVTKDFSVGMRGVKLRAVDQLNLDVGDNEIFGLLGPNGCGKSTTIKIVLGLLRPSMGDCEIFGQPSHTVAARASVGFLPEAPYFYRFLTGRELVRYYGKLCGMRRAQLSAAVDSVIELVQMEEAADRRVGTYSKGMLQRIGLAQALVHDPRLVILDEPTAGVDPLGAAAIADIIRELKRRGKTVLVSSHLLAQMEGLCDRIAILHRGKLIREGRVEDLLRDQASASLVVDGLSSEGRAIVEQAVREQGGTLRSAEASNVSLDTLFLRDIKERERAHQAKHQVKELER